MLKVELKNGKLSLSKNEAVYNGELVINGKSFTATNVSILNDTLNGETLNTKDITIEPCDMCGCEVCQCDQLESFLEEIESDHKKQMPGFYNDIIGSIKKLIETGDEVKSTGKDNWDNVIFNCINKKLGDYQVKTHLPYPVYEKSYKNEIDELRKQAEQKKVEDQRLAALQVVFDKIDSGAIFSEGIPSNDGNTTIIFKDVDQPKSGYVLHTAIPYKYFYSVGRNLIENYIYEKNNKKEVKPEEITFIENIDMLNAAISVHGNIIAYKIEDEHLQFIFNDGKYIPSRIKLSDYKKYKGNF